MTKESSVQTTAVQVALRIRPLTDRDRAQPRFANLAHDDVLKIHESTVQVVPQNKLFTFDHVFGTTSTQKEIFSALGDNLIRKFVEGYNITILAYGQTSSGKTYTMGTAADGGHNTADEGIVPRSMALLFDLLHNNNDIRPLSPTSSVSSSTSASNKSSSRLRPKSKIGSRSSHVPQVPQLPNSAHKTRFTVKVSFIEIYNEDLHDLLNSAPLEELPPITIREDTKGRIYWTGVKEVLVHSTDDVLYYLEQGTQNRATGSTDMNEKSSRSHAIFTVSLKQEKWMPSSATPEKKRPASSMSTRSSITPNTSRLLTAQEDGEWLITTSKFHFVDLAGSERLKRTAAEGDRRKEGININAGLLALGNVISALGDPSKKIKVHIPYRDSKLTRLLQDSLGGSATTLMIACASPVEYNLAETLNTLQYANRARNIKNRSEKNQVEEWMTTENIELLRSLIGKLKNELNYVKSNSSPTSDKDDEDEEYHDQRMLIADLQRQVEELDGEASVTRERNRIVEKELQRVRRLEAMIDSKQEEEQVDFQHLVEPVIEEYEKSVSKLESQLALTKAALSHSDMGFEEQQTKLAQLETLIRSQEQTISELRLRLGKVLEREQSNESYIHELETKLMKSASETTKDQEMLNDLKNKIMKFKETDENTEQYIHSLEQRLASGDAERSRLRTCVEDLESKIEAKERTNVELLRRLSKSTSDNSTEKLMLKELDEVNAKNLDLTKERDSLQQQIKDLQKENHRISISGSVNESNGDNTTNSNATLEADLKTTSIASPTKFKNRKSFADETETPSSVAALTLIQAESRVKEEAERADRLQRNLDNLQFDHQETLKELEEVLQRYHESLEQLDFFERDSSSITAHEEEVISLPKSLDLSKEIAQAKEDAHEQEKQAFATQIANLQEALSKQKHDSELDTTNRIQKLEHELEDASTQLKQMESKHNATVEEDKNLLELEKRQTKQWKGAHAELKKDIEKITLDLDEKENYIVQLKEKLDQHASLQTELQTCLDTSNQQSTSLQKRLAETLASLTVLKISHDGLLKKQAATNDTHLIARHKQEKESLVDRHQSELINIQETMEEMDQVLKNATMDKDTALEKILALETQLKEQTEKAQNNNYLDLENMLQDYDARISALTHQFETQSNDLKEKMASLETELELSKNIHEETLNIHNQRLREATSQHNATVDDLEEEIHKLQQDSDNHYDQFSALEDELNNLKALHADGLENLNFEHQSQLDAIKSEKESLAESHSNQREVQHSETSTKLNVLQHELDNLEISHAKQLEQLSTEHQMSLEAITTEHLQASAQHSKQMSALQLELSNLKDLLAEHQLAYDSQKSKNQQVNSQHSEASRQLNLLQHKFDQLNTQQEKTILDHQVVLETMKSEHEKLVAQLQSVHATESKVHRAKLESERTGLTEKIVSLESELILAKADHVTLAQAHEAEISGYLTRHEQEHLNFKLMHSKQVENMERDHTSLLEASQADASREYTGKLSAKTHDNQGAVDELRQELQLLRTSQIEKETIISHQRQTIESQVFKINELSNDVGTEERISQLEKEIKQLGEENLEYTSLAEELEKEIHRMTEEKEVLAEDLDMIEESVQLYQEKINDMKSMLGVISDDALVPKIKELIQERSTSMSIVDSSETQDDQSYANNNDISNKNGSGAIPQQPGPQETFNAAEVLERQLEQVTGHKEQLKKELHNCQNQMKDMITRDKMEALEKQLNDEKQKLDKSDRIIKKLEKQLDELLKKKSSFMCF